MKRIILAAMAISTIAIAANAPVASAATIGFNIGGVALGYSDGYWDQGHRWHHWRRGELERFRHERANDYHGWRHDDRRHH